MYSDYARLIKSEVQSETCASEHHRHHHLLVLSDNELLDWNASEEVIK
jgi:hypothetical protein